MRSLNSLSYACQIKPLVRNPRAQARLNGQLGLAVRVGSRLMEWPTRVVKSGVAPPFPTFLSLSLSPSLPSTSLPTSLPPSTSLHTSLPSSLPLLRIPVNVPNGQQRTVLWSRTFRSWFVVKYLPVNWRWDWLELVLHAWIPCTCRRALVYACRFALVYACKPFSMHACPCTRIYSLFYILQVRELPGCEGFPVCGR